MNINALPFCTTRWADIPPTDHKGERGVARWHVRHAPRMLAWPRPMAPDNHWVLQA